MLPALVAIAASGDHGGWELVERNFVNGLGVADGITAPSSFDRAVGDAWFLVFRDVQQAFGIDGYFGSPTCILVSWVLIAIALAVCVAGALGPLRGAVAVVFTLVHPQLRELGASMTPWLPATVFAFLGLAFLPAMALPTIQRRARSPGRWVPRMFAILGCGLSWGLASSAEARCGWLMLIPGFLLILAVFAVSLTLWRLRDRGLAGPGALLVNPWAILRRALPWAACWFFVLLIFIWIYEALLPASAETLPGVPPITGVEVALAWLVLPGVLVLAWREGELIGYRSQLGGRTVLFVCLASIWLIGPALRTEAGPLERLLQVPALAAALASVLPGLRRQRA